MAKKIKPLIKKVLFRLLKSRQDPFHIDKPVDVFEGRSIKRVLLLRQDRIGDVLITVPFIKELKKVLPDSKIDIIMSNKNYGVRRAVEAYTDNILIYKKGILDTISLFREIRSNSYDLIIDLFDNPSTTSSFFIRFGRSGFSLGLDKDNAYVYSHIVKQPDRQKHHAVERAAYLLLAFGINPYELDLEMEYPITEEEKNKAEKIAGPQKGEYRLGINLSGSSRSKYWGTDNLIAFINEFQKLFPDFECLLFSTGDYKEENDLICSRTGARSAPLVGSVHEYAVMLNTCDYLLTPDTAAVHFASAWQMPCVALFDNSGQSFRGIPWYPYNSPHRLVTTDSGKLDNIKPDELIEAISDLIREAGEK